MSDIQQELTKIQALAAQAGGLYEIFGIDADTLNDEIEAKIKGPYRKLAMKYHPDRNPSEEAKTIMSIVNTAKAILEDKEKRYYYDNFGPDKWETAYQNKGGSGAFDAKPQTNEEVLQELFGDVFGDGDGHDRRSRRQGGMRRSNFGRRGPG